MMQTLVKNSVKLNQLHYARQTPLDVSKKIKSKNLNSYIVALFRSKGKKQRMLTLLQLFERRLLVLMNVLLDWSFYGCLMPLISFNITNSNLITYTLTQKTFHQAIGGGLLSYLST